MAENENRQRALEDALKKIEKSYGKGAVMKLGEKVDTQIQTVSSGSLALDIALGVGGSRACSASINAATPPRF